MRCTAAASSVRDPLALSPDESILEPPTPLVSERVAGSRDTSVSETRPTRERLKSGTGERLKTLQAEKASLTEADEEASSEKLIIRPHSNISQLYRRKVEELEFILTGPDATQTIDLIRSTIEPVVLRPKVPGNGPTLELYGELANILAACEGAKTQKKPRSFHSRGVCVCV